MRCQPPNQEGHYLVKTWCEIKHIEIVRQLDTKELMVVCDGSKMELERWFWCYIVSEWKAAPSLDEMWERLTTDSEPPTEAR